jgi:aspartate 1-decarboxylase
MYKTMLSGKLHGFPVTERNIDYEGSCVIDPKLLESVGIEQYEQIHIYNITNGNRFITYAIAGEPGSRDIKVQGVAAHLCFPGDSLIICSYVTKDMERSYSSSTKPNILEY